MGRGKGREQGHSTGGEWSPTIRKHERGEIKASRPWRLNLFFFASPNVSFGKVDYKSRYKNNWSIDCQDESTPALWRASRHWVPLELKIRRERVRAKKMAADEKWRVSPGTSRRPSRWSLVLQKGRETRRPRRNERQCALVYGPAYFRVPPRVSASLRAVSSLRRGSFHNRSPLSESGMDSH